MRRSALFLGLIMLCIGTSSQAFSHSNKPKSSSAMDGAGLPSMIHKASPHMRVIALGGLMYAHKKVNWLLMYDYEEQVLQLIFSALLSADELEQNAHELGNLTGEVRFVDSVGNTIFLFRQKECTASQIEALQCKFLDLTSDLHAKLQAFPLFSKVEVYESLQNPAIAPP